ncbi:MAG: hypothetical protein OSJ65_06375 [Bacilli bacterium]|nr:hypothetical protein [Bacilli bacterium]
MKIGDKIEVEIKGTKHSAEIVTFLEKNAKKYVIYVVSGNEESTLYVSEIVLNNGKEILASTEDKEVIDYVLKLISHKVKFATNASKENIKKGYESSPRRDDIITKSSFGNTKVTEKNMEDAINIMKEWKENNQ